MKKGKYSNLGLKVLAILGLVGLITWFYWIDTQEHYLNRLTELSIYYKSMGEMETGFAYHFLLYLRSYLYLFVIGIFLVIADVFIMVDINYEFKHYPGIRKKRKNKFYFNLAGMLLIWLISYLIIFHIHFHIDTRHNSDIIFYDHPFQILLPLIFIFMFIKWRIYRDLDKITRRMNSQEVIEDLPVHTEQRSKSFIFFSIMLFITLIVNGLIIVNYFNYRQYKRFPEELLITEQSELNYFWKEKVCKLDYDDFIYCSDELILEQYYQLETINFYLDEDEYRELIGEHDNYRIVINNYIINDDVIAYLDSDYFTVESQSEEYKFTIDIKRYFEELGVSDKNVYRINFIDQDGERIEIDTESFQFKFVKLGDAEE